MHNHGLFYLLATTQKTLVIVPVKNKLKKNLKNGNPAARPIEHFPPLAKRNHRQVRLQNCTKLHSSRF